MTVRIRLGLRGESLKSDPPVRCVAGPTRRLSAQVHPDRLGLGVGEEPFLAQLSSEPALLDASEGRRRIELVVRIDPDRPGAQGLRRAVRLLDVARPDTGAQSVERIVRLFEDLV